MQRAFIVTSCREAQDRHDRGSNPIMGNGRAIYRPSIVCESRSIAQPGLAKMRVIHSYWVALVLSVFQLALAFAVKVEGSLAKFAWPVSLAKT